MSEYKEVDVCSEGQPIIEITLCPSELISPEPEDLPMCLTVGVDSYYGCLTTDIPDRITRVARLVGELWKRLNWISAQFSVTMIHKFKYPSADDLKEKVPDKIVTGGAFEFVRLMLAEIDFKMDRLTSDLEAIRPVASVPEHWQIRPEANRPMGVFLFGEWESGDDRIQSPKWQICVPHWQPENVIGFDNTFGYTKGSYQFLYTLNDNSKIIFYGNDRTEMQIVLDRWLSGVDSSKLSGSFLKEGEIKGLPFSVRRLRLIRIDYYQQGIMKSTPTRYIKFPRRPLELGSE